MRLKQEDVWSADFETTTEANLKKDGYVRVWLWSLVRCDLKMKLHGNDMFSFLEQVKLWQCKGYSFQSEVRRKLHRRLAAPAGVRIREALRYDNRRNEHLVLGEDLLVRGPQDIY